MRAALYKSKLIFFQKHRPRWQTFLLRNLVLRSASAKAFAYTIAAQVDALRAPGWRERATSFQMVIDAVKTVPT